MCCSMKSNLDLFSYTFTFYAKLKVRIELNICRTYVIPLSFLEEVFVGAELLVG